MKKVRLDLHRLSVLDLVGSAKNVHSCMDGNKNFETPDIPLDEFLGQAVQVEEYEIAYQKSVKDTSALKEKRDQSVRVLMNTYGTYGSYVDRISQGDASIIKSAGMDTRANKTPTAIPNRVEDLKVKGTDTATELQLKWKALPKVKSYMIRYTVDIADESKWQNHSVGATKASILIKDLQPKTQYWFQVAGLGSAGLGAYSDPATKIAG